MSWRDSALCAQVDPAIWFPERGGSSREGKAICEVCPSRQECLQEALDSPFPVTGIWGGTSEYERRAMLASAPPRRGPNRPGCTVNGCDRTHKGRGYCQSHYNQYVRRAS